MITKTLSEWRARVLARDQFICQKCGAVDSFVAHHIKSRDTYPELIKETENGQTLCQLCHHRIPAQGEISGRKQSHDLMQVGAFAVLPYQKEHLREISQKTKKTQSELVREALGFLFSQYQKMGY